MKAGPKARVDGSPLPFAPDSTLGAARLRAVLRRVHRDAEGHGRPDADAAAGLAGRLVASVLDPTPTSAARRDG